MHGVLRSYGARYLVLATRRRGMRNFEELQGEALWFDGVVGGALAVTRVDLARSNRAATLE